MICRHNICRQPLPVCVALLGYENLKCCSAVCSGSPSYRNPIPICKNNFGILRVLRVDALVIAIVSNGGKVLSEVFSRLCTFAIMHQVACEIALGILHLFLYGSSWFCVTTTLVEQEIVFPWVLKLHFYSLLVSSGGAPLPLPPCATPTPQDQKSRIGMQMDGIEPRQARTVVLGSTLDEGFRVVLVLARGSNCERKASEAIGLALCTFCLRVRVCG